MGSKGLRNLKQNKLTHSSLKENPNPKHHNTKERGMQHYKINAALNECSIARKNMNSSKRKEK